MAIYHRLSGLEKDLMELFPTSTDKKEDDVRMLMEIYMMYKKNYMKHLQFDSGKNNRSKLSSFSHHI